MALVINGRFLTRPITGVERYGHMLMRVIAQEWPDSRVVLPARADATVDTCGLEVVRHSGLGGHAWEQLQLPAALRQDDVLISPANTGPLRVRRQVVVVHDLAVIHHPEWFDRRFAQWYGFLLPRLTRRAARVITVSEYSKLDLEQTYSLSPDRVVVVPAYAGYLPRPDPREERTRPPYILVVATRDPRKGLDRLVEWYGKLSAPQFRLMIVGRDAAQFRPVALRSVEGVVLRSDVDDVELNELYANAIALVHLSRFEGFGLPILEAMAAGCPVIASELPVLRSNFGSAVMYLPEDDLDPLQAMVLGLMAPDRRRHHVDCGKQCAARFTSQRMASALKEALGPLQRS
ncbi:MAG: glycosyltransferase family 4 protein [Flavobacteriales bacterium]|nr:glycosyltransferase family 4 protein [Flavobacteriales bacterium]